MSVFKKILPVLLCFSLLCCTACTKKEETPQAQTEITPEESAVPAGTEETGTSAKSSSGTPVSETRADGSADIYVTVPTVEISLAELKEKDYTVPVYISLDQNSGINYAEWGASYDARCTLDYDKFDKEVTFNNIVCSVNEEKHFFWTAWASSDNDPRTGNLIMLLLKLPQEAKAGDMYSITYEPVSLANKPHVWNHSEHNWVRDGVVGWTDGGVSVTE